MAGKTYLDVSYFLELQARLLDTFSYASCHERNFQTYSIKLESVIVDTCSFLDSLSQVLLRELGSSGHSFSNGSAVSDLSKKVAGSASFSAGNQRKLLEADFKLSTRRLLVLKYEDNLYMNPLAANPGTLTGYSIAPFEEWDSGHRASWWDAYTHLKHDRLGHFTKATLHTALHAVGAVFVVLTVRHEKEFKEGHVDPRVYDLFMPRYWSPGGRVMPGMIRWL